MDDLLELFLEIILAPIWGAYADLVEELIGYKKLKKWQGNLLKLLCLGVSIIAGILIIFGALFMFEDKSLISDYELSKRYGLIFLIVGGSVLGVHILIGWIAREVHAIKKRIKLIEAIKAKREKSGSKNIRKEENADEKNDLQ